MEPQGGSEVRRLHIIYFLSRKGSIEHPHLIRVHHHSKNGVRLRDVKRWLGELRGKEIQESFSWSYKRRYKTGYVWQDLLDDDLITPISDNEFVIKGSEISSPTIKEQKVVNQKDQEQHKAALCKEEKQSHSSETSIHVSTKSSSEIEEESPTFGSETSTVTDCSARLEMEKTSANTIKRDDKIERSMPFYSTFLSKKNKKKKSNKVTIDEKNISKPIDDPCKTSSSEPHFTKSKSHASNASQILRNLITCRDVDTNDTAAVAVKRRSKAFLSMCSTDVGNVHSSEICKRDRFGGSQRVFGNPSWTHQEFSSRNSFDGVKDSAKRASSAAYKPANRPNCSQCGKNFKPEKLHAHMKSCKGMKALLKGAADAAVSAAAEKATKKGDSVSGNLLTH